MISVPPKPNPMRIDAPSHIESVGILDTTQQGHILDTIQQKKNEEKLKYTVPFKQPNFLSFLFSRLFDGLHFTQEKISSSHKLRIKDMFGILWWVNFVLCT